MRPSCFAGRRPYARHILQCCWNCRYRDGIADLLVSIFRPKGPLRGPAVTKPRVVGPSRFRGKRRLRRPYACMALGTVAGLLLVRQTSLSNMVVALQRKSDDVEIDAVNFYDHCGGRPPTPPSWGRPPNPPCEDTCAYACPITSLLEETPNETLESQG